MKSISKGVGAAALLLALAPLAACGEKADATGPAAVEPSSKTLTATVKDEGDLSTLGGVIDGAGLGTLLDGKGPYTVLAPTNAALQAGGVSASADPAQRAQTIALLRAHILPGVLTRADIGAAIDAAQGKAVEMRTMDGGLLKFARDGDAITVTAPDGAVGRLTGAEKLASNGAVQPVDAVLVKAAG